MVEHKVVLVNWASFGLEVAKERVQEIFKGAQTIEANITIVDKDVVVNLEGVVIGSLNMHKSRKTPHDLTMVANCRNPNFGLTTKARAYMGAGQD
jgi:hypothetical protein